MSGTPMHVAIALGVLVSEVCHPAFRDKVLTFSEDPRWHQLQPGAAFVDKVQSLQSAHWGGSTDFAKAMRKIAELVSAERLEQHDHAVGDPTLVLEGPSADVGPLLSSGFVHTAETVGIRIGDGHDEILLPL